MFTLYYTRLLSGRQDFLGFMHGQKLKLFIY